MSSENPRLSSGTSESSPLLGSARRSSTSVSRERSSVLSPETLLLPVAFATMLAMAIPATTFIDLQRRAICELWKRTHGRHDSFLPSADSDVCHSPEVARYFATAMAIFGTTAGVLSMSVFGIVSRALIRSRRRPAFLFIIGTRLLGSCLIPGSQYVPARLSPWIFFAGMMVDVISGLVPYFYLLRLYIVDICTPDNRTAALSKVQGSGSLGTCISLAAGGFITTRTGNPLIVFHVAAAIYVVAFVYVLFVLPETFKPSSEDPESSTQERQRTSALASLSHVIAPLKALMPARNRNWRLTWCGVHMFAYLFGMGYTMTAWLVLVTSRYNLTPADTGVFLTSTTVSSTVVLTLIVPWLVRVLRPFYTQQRTDKPPEDGDDNHSNNDPEAKPESETSDHLEVHLAFLSCVVAGVFHLSAAAFPTTNGALIVSGLMLGFTSMHGPTFSSLVAGSVDPKKQGEALAAIEMVAQVGGVLSLIVMGSLLTLTIESMPLLLFYVHLIVMLIGGGLLFLIRDSDRCRSPRED